MTNKLIFFGNERLVSGLDHTDAPILNSLILAGYEIKAVVTNDAGTKTRKQKVLTVAEVAAANNIPVRSPHRPMDIYEELAAYQADAAVLVAYGRIVPQKLIDLFPFGIINVHPSLLPKYRGPSPIESAIVNGDHTTGVSIMALSAKMDAGPIYSQVEHIVSSQSAPQLARELTNVAASELTRILPTILDGSLSPVEQDESQATYCHLIDKKDAWLDPQTHTAEEAERAVRAYLAYPRSRLNVHGHDIIILQAHVSREQASPLDVAFSDGTYLSIDELIAPSGKKMNAAAFIQGYLKSDA